MNYQLSPERDWIIPAHWADNQREVVLKHRTPASVCEQRLMTGQERLAAMYDTQDDTLTRRQEKLDLIRLLRDETNSASVYARCVAIVGERQP